uniref:Uncharacterized protein n=1 Tax=Arundo donax TaxID=35708 RepID=A0A0A8YFC3_ARUDO
MPSTARLTEPLRRHFWYIDGHRAFKESIINAGLKFLLLTDIKLCFKK